MKRNIEWSLRALASTRAVRLFLRERAVIQYVLRAASTLENTGGEQRALRKFPGQDQISLYCIEKKRFAQSNRADTVQQIPAAYSQLCRVGDDVKLRQVSSSELQSGTSGERSRRSKAF